MLFFIVSSQANIRNTFFAQSSPRHREVGVWRWHGQTDRQTHGHRDSMTESAQWANSLKIPHTGDTESLGVCG